MGLWPFAVEQNDLMPPHALHGGSLEARQVGPVQEHTAVIGRKFAERSPRPPIQFGFTVTARHELPPPLATS